MIHGIVSTHSYLSYVDVTICSLHQTEILLTDTLTLSSELCDSTEWSRLR
ncbi:Uncharacterised protein [Segatella copri]|nr:Uncharacterised protein [Segatella copri]